MIGCYLLSGKGLPKIARAPIFCHRKWNRRIVKWWTQFASSKCFFQNHLCQDRALETWSTMNIYENLLNISVMVSLVFPRCFRTFMNIYEHHGVSQVFPRPPCLPPCHHCLFGAVVTIVVPRDRRCFARSTLLRRHQTCSNLSSRGINMDNHG